MIHNFSQSRLNIDGTLTWDHCQVSYKHTWNLHSSEYAIADMGRIGFPDIQLRSEYQDIMALLSNVKPIMGTE